jgi:peptidoglycan/LPS O-acetylase OafA/YrhL
LRRGLSLPWVTAIGGMCYSIYLIHYQVISLVGRVTRDIPFSHYFWANLLVQCVVVGVPTLVLSAGFYLTVEKPCMNKDWPGRLLAWFRARQRFGGASREPIPVRMPDGPRPPGAVHPAGAADSVGPFQAFGV